MGHVQKRWALHYVVIKINDVVQFCMMSKVLAVRTFNRPNNRLYANSNEYAIRNNKGDQVSSIAAIWGIYYHIIMGPPEESVESQHSYCPNDDKIGVSTTKIKYLTQMAPFKN